MVSSVGADITSVRVHTGDPSARLSKKVNTQAFTVGNAIFFDKNNDNPHTPRGQRLSTHERTHTVQQTGSVSKKIQRLGDLSQLPPGMPRDLPFTAYTETDIDR